MNNESVFNYSRVECPICKTVNEFETIKPGSFNEVGRDADFCPTNIEWTVDKYKTYNPLIYFMAVCSHCFYAREFNAQFEGWKSDDTFINNQLKEIKTNHLDKLAEADSIIKKIATEIDVARYPNESGVLKFHLSIYDELLSSSPSNLNLGRYYLRLGWIFRNYNHVNENSETTIMEYGNGLENQFKQLFDSLSQSHKNLKEIKNTLDANTSSDDKSSRDARYWSAINYMYENDFEAISELLNNFSLKTDGFDFDNCEYKSVLNSENKANNYQTFGSYKSFGHFLDEIKSEWNEVALNEEEALEKAVEYFIRAYNNDSDLHQGNQKLQVTYLIAELSRRIGNYDQAREYFNQTIACGQDYINQNREDKAATALAKKILELAIEKGTEKMAVQTI